MTPQLFLIMSSIIFTGVLAALINDYMNAEDTRLSMLMTRVSTSEKFFLDLAISLQDQINELKQKPSKKPLLPKEKVEDIPSYTPSLKVDKDEASVLSMP